VTILGPLDDLASRDRHLPRAKDMLHFRQPASENLVRERFAVDHLVVSQRTLHQEPDPIESLRIGHLAGSSGHSMAINVAN